MFPATGKIYLGKIKLPRSKRKRIRNKWLKKQCFGKCANFKFEEIGEFPKIDLNVNEVIFFSTVKVVTPCSFTLDDISEENIKLLMSGESK